jgi:hypothetical protein
MVPGAVTRPEMEAYFTMTSFNSSSEGSGIRTSSMAAPSADPAGCKGGSASPSDGGAAPSADPAGGKGGSASPSDGGIKGVTVPTPSGSGAKQKESSCLPGSLAGIGTSPEPHDYCHLDGFKVQYIL